MKAKFVSLLAAAAILLAACIPSVNPFYLSSDIAFDSRLVGEWSDDPERDDAERWVFESLSEQDAYQLTIIESDGTRGTLRATLFELDNTLFLDLIPNEFEFPDDEVEVIGASLFTGHLVMHVAEIEPRLIMSFFEFEDVGEFLEENPKALSHVVQDDRILLTGKTRELQRFLRKHIDDGWLFDDYSDMTRLSTAN